MKKKSPRRAVSRDGVQDIAPRDVERVLNSLRCTVGDSPQSTADDDPVEFEIRRGGYKQVFRFPLSVDAATRRLFGALADYVAACQERAYFDVLEDLDDAAKETRDRDLLEVRWEAHGQKGLLRLTPPRKK